MSLHFDREPTIRDFIEFRRREIFEDLKELLPFAELFHVGSTAVENGWTSGEVDVLVRVDKGKLAEARKLVSGRFEPGEREGVFRHEGRGVKVVVSDGDDLVSHRNFLSEQPLVRERYDAIKRRFQGGDPDAYRAAKDAFWTEWAKQAA